MDYMQRISVFTLGNFVEMMSEIKAQSGVEGWSKMFRTKEQQEQLEQVMVDVKVGEQLLPQELRNPSLVGRRQRLRMASDAGVVSLSVFVFACCLGGRARPRHAWPDSDGGSRLAMLQSCVPIPTPCLGAGAAACLC